MVRMNLNDDFSTYSYIKTEVVQYVATT